MNSKLVPDYSAKQTITSPFIAPSNGFIIADNLKKKMTLEVYIDDVLAIRSFFYDSNDGCSLNAPIGAGQVATITAQEMYFVPYS